MDGFHTLRGYGRLEKAEVSHAMEDYLEMIFRLSARGSPVRVSELAALLNVRPPAASRMATRLRGAGLVHSEPYGVISLTGAGAELGAYLIHRHEVLSRFFRLVNGTQGELELVEKIEHFMDRRTVDNLERLTRRLALENRELNP